MQDPSVSACSVGAYSLLTVGLLLGFWWVIPDVPNINGPAIWCTGLGLLIKVRGWLLRIQCDKASIYEAGRAKGYAEANGVSPTLHRIQ